MRSSWCADRSGPVHPSTCLPDSIPVGAEAEVRSKLAVAFVVQVKTNALALPEHAEHGAVEAAWFQQYFGAIVIADNRADAGGGVVCLHDALHQTFSTLPALMHEVHTRARREFVPCLTRIF